MSSLAEDVVLIAVLALESGEAPSLLTLPLEMSSSACGLFTCCTLLVFAGYEYLRHIFVCRSRVSTAEVHILQFPQASLRSCTLPGYFGTSIQSTAPWAIMPLLPWTPLRQGHGTAMTLPPAAALPWRCLQYRGEMPCYTPWEPSLVQL